MPMQVIAWACTLEEPAAAPSRKASKAFNQRLPVYLMSYFSGYPGAYLLARDADLFQIEAKQTSCCSQAML